MESIQSTVARSHVNLATSRIKPRRTGVPCVRCRQMKVKCNASQKSPAPCSGCEKAGERCAVDPLFKRTPKRSMKIRPGTQSDTTSTTPHSVLSGTVPTELSSHSDDPLSDPNTLVESLIFELRIGSRRSVLFTHEATGINLASSVVAEMLEEYYYQLYPRFPLALDPKTVIDSYEKEPLLFWAILTIASKDSEKHAPVNTRLQILSRQLAADIILLGSRSIYLVQALILLYVWSSPHGSMNKEPLSMYCTLAISMARSLGLHRPQYPFPLFSAQASELGTLETRRSTWLCCFIIDQWHSARFGIPSTIRIDHSVLHALNDSSSGLPVTTRIQLQIALVTSKISTALGECEASPTGLNSDPLPFVRVFETELSMIQDKYASEWSPAEEVSFLDARLGLYSYVLHKIKNQPLEALRPVTGLITQSSTTAKQLLTVVAAFPEVLSKGVFHAFRCTSYAVFCLLRMLGTTFSQFLDKADIKNVIRQTFALMKDMSQSGNDRRFQCVRVCRIIEEMIDFTEWDSDIPFTGRAESFMANNIVAEVGARGIIKANQRHAAAAQTERDREGSPTAGSQAEVELDFDLDISIWDPMEWDMNWQDIDDLLLSSSSTGGFS